MGFNMFNKTLEILDLENRYYFLNISAITRIEFMNIEMYILVQQIHIRLWLKLAKIRKLIVIWRPSWICMIFQLKHTYFLNRRSFCNVNTLDMIKYNNCVFVFILKSKISDLVIYWPPFWISAAILNSCLNKIIINRLSHIDVIYFSEKNHLIKLNRTRYMNNYSFLAVIFDFAAISKIKQNLGWPASLFRRDLSVHEAVEKSLTHPCISFCEEKTYLI